MPDWLRLAAKFIGEKIGWHRIGFALSLAIIVAAVVVLYRMLNDLDLHELLQTLKSFNKGNIAMAAAAVAAGYVTLTLYDLFALRAIGKDHVPYRIAALAGFTSYAVGHNVGASVFTGGAVRYRIYSRYGLSAIDVAKLCFIAGLTFWLGNVTVLGLGVLYSPKSAAAIDHLPLWFNRAAAGALLLMLASYVIWVWRHPRNVGHANWEVTLPRGPLTLLQIAIGIVDLACCALAMYMLVPVSPHMGFIELSVIFVSATLLGFASHSPGGLGVFDAAMVGALLHQFDKEELVAGLLLFRLLYYITPFALALALLGARELWLSVSRRPKPPLAPLS
ncbi:MAG: lysylphosphatidylglycerol synthase domain-containing protein [Xanthobacteraceae bacterium]